VFFSALLGSRFWEFEGHELAARFPESGQPLTALGIASLVSRVDAAAVGLGSLNRRVYLFSGYEYWRLQEDRPGGRMAVDRYYPQEISNVFRGVPPNIDAAFTNVDGKLLTAFYARKQLCFQRVLVDPSAAPPTCFRPAAVKFGWRAGLSRRAVENPAGAGANIYRRRRRRESAPLSQHSNKRCRR